MVIMTDYGGEQSYQYFDVWYVASPWSSSEIFLKDLHDGNLWKMSKYGILQKLYTNFIEQINSEGYFDARTECDTFLGISPSIIDSIIKDTAR